MNNKYNVMITYNGDGIFKFYIRKIGEVEISKTKPIYIYNADVDTINNLRELKRLLINITIGAKPTGAFRIFNMDDYETPKNVQIKEHVNSNYNPEPISNAEISSILKSGKSVIEDNTSTTQAEKPRRRNTRKNSK